MLCIYLKLRTREENACEGIMGGEKWKKTIGEKWKGGYDKIVLFSCKKYQRLKQEDETVHLGDIQ